MQVRVIYRHPQGRFEVRERTGRGALGGGTYVVREAVLTPQKDSRGTFHRPRRKETAHFHYAPPTDALDEVQPMREYRRMTEDEQGRAAVLFRKGYNVADIARNIGRDESTVASFLERAGMRKRKPKNLLTEEELARAEELHAQGMSIREAAHRIGRSYATVYDRMQKKARKKKNAG